MKHRLERWYIETEEFIEAHPKLAISFVCLLLLVALAVTGGDNV